MGSIADVSASTRVLATGGVSWRLGGARRCVLAFRTFHDLFPIATMGITADVYVSALSRNNGWRLGGVWWRQPVSARVLKFPRPVPHCPHGKSADVYASTRAFGQRVASGGVLVASVRECSPFELSATFSPLPPWEAHRCARLCTGRWRCHYRRHCDF